ncbi:hypothetical protein CLV88_1324 [Shimia abyssi]|uniref:Cytochrome c domain-containing protein n=2 Tax=Shimia abyssi TaxID=1662395 RepID=A0A2P8EVT1_9RHOB|nr:hypothetical protein CLV88_1324 [Shimia abyssi]
MCAVTLALPAIAEQTTLGGRDLFVRYCARCHGDNARGGQGNTTTAAPGMTKIAERRGSVWPMLEIMSIIDGYTKATEPRVEMPVIPELTEGTQIEFDTGNGNSVAVPASLVAIVNYLESIQWPRPERYVP